MAFNPADKPNWNTVLSLAGGQALYQTGSILVTTLSSLVGLDLAPDVSMATLPIAVISIGSALTLIPASLVMRRHGRKTGFLLGTGMGFMAGLVASLAIWQADFWLFVGANMLIGSYQGFAQYYRFAAADSVPPQYKGQAISWVMAAGVLAALAGPTLAKLTKDLGPVPFVYAYGSISLLSVIAALLIGRLPLPVARVTVSDKGISPERMMPERTLGAIVRQPLFLAAITASTIGYAVMVMVMTATPIAMKLCGHTTSDAATVIQWHVLGMFAPSFLTGNLIRRFGVVRIILAGILILSVHVGLALTGTDFLHFVSVLVLLGVGWNLMFVGGSTLLTQAYRPGEQSKTQATHDFLVFGITSMCSFLAGAILNEWGWKTINLVALPLLVAAWVVIQVYHVRAKRRLATAE